MVAGDAACWCADLPPLAELPARPADKQAQLKTGPAPCLLLPGLPEIIDPPDALMMLAPSPPGSLPLSLPSITPTADLACRPGCSTRSTTRPSRSARWAGWKGWHYKLGLIQRSDTGVLQQPQMVVFAADHGVTAEGVSAFPQAVTVQMVANMLAGGAAINVFARQHGFALQVATRRAADLPAHPHLQQCKIASGPATFASNRR